MTLLRALLVWLALLLPAAAQDDPLPRPVQTTVNDFAGVLTAADTRLLDEALTALRARTGVQGTVVTLPDRRRYGAQSLEAFAGRLFDAWGVGEAGRDDGFMVLVIPAAREARIELGAGYGRSLDSRMAAIMDRVTLPALREGRLSDGLREGTLAVIRQIAEPAGASHGGGGGWLDRLLPPAVFGVFGLTGLGLLRGFLRKRRDARCPRCGTPLAPDPATRRRHCPACGWQDDRPLPVAPLGRRERRRHGREDGGGFGGGRSGGGGASGRW